MSYWQFRDKDLNVIKRRKLANPEVNFMVDSGAHTLITSWDKFKHWTRKMFDDYVEEYARWLHDNRQYLSCAVEVDIDFTLNMILAGNENSMLGPKIVEGWQKAHFEPLQKKGLDIVYCWHTQRKMEGWEEMCSKFDYVGLPGFLSSEPDFNKYMAIAKRYTTRIHGFAATKQIDFRDAPWYSIDSITWKAPEMWGVMLVWDERKQKFTSVGDKTKRHYYKNIIAKSGFDVDKIVNDTDYKEGTKYGLFSMRQMEAFYENKYSDRTFYYELRLPHRDVIRKALAKKLQRWWKLFRPDTLFKDYIGCDCQVLTEILCTISAVQNGDSNYISGTKFALEFLGKYFPKLINPLVSDIKLLQQEFSIYTSPPNPPPLDRTEVSHYDMLSTAPREREILLSDEEGGLELERPEEYLLIDEI